MGRLTPRHAVLWIVMVIVAAACSGPSQIDASGDPLLLETIRAAEEEGVAGEQIDELRGALRDGSLSYEALDRLTALTVDCINNAGARAFETDPREEAPGLLVPNFGVRPGPGQTDAAALRIMGECMGQNMAYAQEYYLAQPSSAELAREAFEVARPSVVECLEQRGLAIEAGATDAEILATVDDDIAQNGATPGFEPCYLGTLAED